MSNEKLLLYFEEEIRLYTGVNVTSSEEDMGFYCFRFFRLTAEQLISMGHYIRNDLNNEAIVNSRHGRMTLLVRVEVLQDIYKKLEATKQPPLLLETRLDSEMTINAT